MFELFLVMITLSSPILFIVLIRNYFRYKNNVFDEQTMLLQELQNKQKITEDYLDSLLIRMTELEHQKHSS